VSLLSPERLLIALAPDEMSWVRLRGRYTPEVSGAAIVPIRHDANVRRTDGVIATLLSEAEQWQQEPVAVRIVLSNNFMRYAVVPDDKTVHGAEEELAYARFHIARVYGEISRDWEIRLSRGRGGTRLACAMDGALMGALHQSFSEDHRPRLTSVQPLLMAVFNHQASGIPKEGAWLIVAEAERTCVALLSGNSWQAAHNIKGRYADPQAWVGLIERVRWGVNLDTVPDTILVYTLQGPVPPDQTLQGWQVKGLHTQWPAGLLPESDHAYAMALCVS